MTKLSERDKERIIELLEKGEDLPLDYKHILFPPEKKEYELVYEARSGKKTFWPTPWPCPCSRLKPLVQTATAGPINLFSVITCR